MSSFDISIIIPCYNKENYLRECLNSVISQKTEYRFEVLLIDDHSSDSTPSIISEYVERYTFIKSLRPTKNVGAAQARNLGITEAAGRYIAFLDADDLWYPNKLQKQISYMIERSVPICCTWYDTVNSAGDRVGCYNPKIIEPKYKDLLYECYVGTSTLIYDTSRLGKCFFPDIRKRQDFALWLKITRENNIAISIFQDEMTSYRTAIKGSVSENKLDCLVYRYRVLREFEKITAARSLFYMFINLFKVVLKRLRY